MIFNKSNKKIKVQQVVKTKNQEAMAKQLFQAADAGFKNGSPWEVNHFYQTLEAANSLVFTASLINNENSNTDDVSEEAEIQSEKIIGVLIASMAAQEIDIYMIVVDEAFKNNRIAYQLFQHLIAYCKTKEIKTIFLEVRVSNKPAIGLYKTLGFEEVGIRNAYYSKPIEDAIVMKLEL